MKSAVLNQTMWSPSGRDIKDIKDKKNEQISRMGQSLTDVPLEKPESRMKIREFTDTQRQKVQSTYERKKDLLAEKFTIAPAPSRDYHGIQIYYDKIVWIRWKIAHGPTLFPQQQTIKLTEYAKDKTLQKEIAFIFTDSMNRFILDLAFNYWNLSSSPPDVLKKICSYLSVKDVLNLSQTCTRLSQELIRDEIWEPLCKKSMRLTGIDIRSAKLMGWKNFYFQKLGPSRSQRRLPPLQITKSSQITKASQSVESLKKTSKKADLLTQFSSRNVKNTGSKTDLSILSAVEVTRVEPSSRKTPRTISTIARKQNLVPRSSLRNPPPPTQPKPKLSKRIDSSPRVATLFKTKTTLSQFGESQTSLFTEK